MLKYVSTKSLPPEQNFWNFAKNTFDCFHEICARPRFILQKTRVSHSLKVEKLIWKVVGWILAGVSVESSRLGRGEVRGSDVLAGISGTAVGGWDLGAD